MFVKVDHVGIAVRSLSAAARLFSERLGVPVRSIETLAEDGARAAVLGQGETRIMLLEPLGRDGPVGRFLEERGEGLHHLSLEVQDLDDDVRRLMGAGIATTGPARPGLEGSRGVFLRPADTGGALIELAEGRARSPERIAAGQTVLVYLQNPKERFWGVMRELAVWGVTVEGVELTSFDAWTSAASQDGVGAATAATTALFPAHRIERILLDRPSGGAESLEERFRSRVGVGLADFLARSR